MNSLSQNDRYRPYSNIAEKDLLSLGADQFAEIIYESIRLREMGKTEGETKSYSAPSSHT